MRYAIHLERLRVAIAKKDPAAGANILDDAKHLPTAWFRALERTWEDADW